MKLLSDFILEHARQVIEQEHSEKIPHCDFLPLYQDYNFKIFYDRMKCFKILEGIGITPKNVLRYLKGRYKYESLSDGKFIQFNKKKCLNYAHEGNVRFYQSDLYKIPTDLAHVNYALSNILGNEIVISGDTLKYHSLDLFVYIDMLENAGIEFELSNSMRDHMVFVLDKYDFHTIVNKQLGKYKRKLLKPFLTRGMITKKHYQDCILRCNKLEKDTREAFELNKHLSLLDIYEKYL